MIGLKIIHIIVVNAWICQSIPLSSDQNTHCRMWAYGGECSKNPGYMLVMCKASCDDYLWQSNPLYYSLLQLYLWMKITWTETMNYMGTLIKILRRIDEYQANTDEEDLFKLILQNVSNQDLPLPAGKDMRLNNRYGFMIDGKFRGISYYSIMDKNVTRRVLGYIRPSLRELFTVSIMQITNPYIYPHTDSMNKISINFYMKTHDAVTSFYNVKRGFSLLSFGSKIEGQTDGRVFEEDSLFKINEFTAKDGDVWILNTKRVHSVRMPDNDSDPNRVRIAYNLRYEGDNSQLKFGDFVNGHLHDFMDKRWIEKTIDDEDEERTMQRQNIINSDHEL